MVSQLRAEEPIGVCGKGTGEKDCVEGLGQHMDSGEGVQCPFFSLEILMCSSDTPSIISPCCAISRGGFVPSASPFLSFNIDDSQHWRNHIIFRGAAVLFGLKANECSSTNYGWTSLDVSQVGIGLSLICRAPWEELTKRVKS